MAGKIYNISLQKTYTIIFGMSPIADKYIIDKKSSSVSECNEI